MGFSVSGAFAVIAIASFMALGMIYSSAAVGFELVREAQQDAHDSQLAEQNTEIEIQEANWTNGGECGLITDLCLIVEATNNGSTALTINSSDLIVDGGYVKPENYQAESVDGDTSTELWLPGETYHIEVSDTVINKFLEDGETWPKRIKLISEHGVAESSDVTNTNSL